MDEREIRLRCIEAAAKTPMVHPQGQAAGVLETASFWFNWIISEPKGNTLGLPKKK
jgi:hypothetical protein